MYLDFQKLPLLSIYKNLWIKLLVGSFALRPRTLILGFLFTLYENFQFFGMTITAIKNPHTLASILLLAKFIVEDKMEKAKFDQLCLCLLTLTKYI